MRIQSIKAKVEPDKITLTDFPFVSWAMGLGFGLTGCAIIVSCLIEPPGFSTLLLILFGSVFAYSGYQLLSSAVYQKIVIDRFLKTVSVKKIGIHHFSTTEYTASDIENFYSEEDHTHKHSILNTICMKLKDGTSMILGTGFNHKAECQTIINTAHEFLEQKDFSDHQPQSVVGPSYQKSRKKLFKRFRR